MKSEVDRKYEQFMRRWKAARQAEDQIIESEQIVEMQGEVSEYRDVYGDPLELVQFIEGNEAHRRRYEEELRNQ